MSPRMTLNDVIFRIGHRDVVTICPVAFFIIDGSNENKHASRVLVARLG